MFDRHALRLYPQGGGHVLNETRAQPARQRMMINGRFGARLSLFQCEYLFRPGHDRPALIALLEGEVAGFAGLGSFTNTVETPSQFVERGGEMSEPY